ncbi:ribonuclease Y [Candidatus Peregrinibacteria bacterium RIFCSPLOWO2_01_FULL_39_12]|nr:MAG: ribonuclease Y [Candidatus Peregrinibacteria bacterium RIFCSPLOWO2_02_FULL_39_10]OGJ42898.1 MAG: ribonuclease Y [Candidatus Peregrinibacteria bacterium RIFCSPLOWO2_01_FULL_39_12]
MITTILLAVIGAVIGVSAGYFYRKKQVEEKNKDLVLKSEQILSDAKNKSKEIIYEARTEALKLQDELKKDEQHQQARLTDIEERLIKKESVLDKKSDDVERLRVDLDSKVTSVKQIREEVESIYKMQSQQLERIAAMSKEEAREVLLKKVEEEAKEDIVVQIKKAEKELEAKADERAKWIIADAISRCAAETTAESTATIVNLPNDEMKGRIIGREGRNINSFEQITGVDVIIDDTPGSIVISGFDLVRRYIAKIALEKLIEDGRIHPARIEETVLKVKDEVNVLIKELGEKAVLETGVTGLHPNLIKILGRLKFKVTHGQNALKHSMEVAFLAANLAAELGADEVICRKAGLLHDIGKAVDHEVPGHHAKIGADIARKFGLPKDVVSAIENHHGHPETLEGQLVQVANLISNARPGASKENLDNYVKRLVELENMCSGFEGVKKSFAVQAGTEVRVFVNPDEIDDLEMVKLAHSVTRKIESDLQHPGPIKVHVIRELRAEEFAT